MTPSILNDWGIGQIVNHSKRTAARLGTGFLSCVLASTLWVADAGAQQVPSWSYSGGTGPQNWGRMTGFSTCGSGKMQSPIDISGTEPALVAPLLLDYQVTSLSILNTGQGLTMAYDLGSNLMVGEKTFPLLGFVMHTPGEHTLSGKSFAAEIQFLHQTEGGERAIVSVMVDEGEDLRAANELINNLPLEPGQTRRLDTVLINARDFAPVQSGYFRYMGSLTTPPCAEGVNWYVMKTPITMSADQINAFRSVMGANNRPVQPRNNRILIDGETVR